MLCPKCNSENFYGSTSCSVCGEPLTSAEQGQANIADSSNSYGNSNYTLQQPIYNSPYSDYNNNNYPQQNNMPYQQNMVNYPPYNDPNKEHVSVMEWIGILCINIVPYIGPLVYFVLLFVWSFGNTTKRSLKTFAQAQLIIIGVMVALLILALILLFAVAGLTLDEIANELP